MLYELIKFTLMQEGNSNEEFQEKYQHTNFLWHLNWNPGSQKCMHKALRVQRNTSFDKDGTNRIL